MPIQPVGGYDDSVEDAPWQDAVNLPGQYGPGGFKRPLGLRPFGLDTTNPPWGGARGQPEIDLPGQFSPGGPPPGGPLNDNLSARSMPAINPYGAGMPRGGPQIFSPQGSNIGTGKEVGAWTNPSTDATPSPQMMADLAKARGVSLPAFLRSNPIAAFLYSTLYSTPAETGEYHPGAHHPGGPPMPVPPAPAPIDPYGPTAMPPTSTPLPSSRPTTAPKPVVRPKIDPKAVDLGYYRPSVGNARTPTFVPPGQTQAPDIFRGLLAQRPT